MKVNLLKRLESSVDSFRITLSKFVHSVDATLKDIEKFEDNAHTYREGASGGGAKSGGGCGCN